MTAQATIDGVPEQALQGSMRDYRVPVGADLLARCHGFFHWQDLRRQSGTWPFSRSTEAGPSASCAIRDDQGVLTKGGNFASQDYLSLSSHPAIQEVARHAADEFGVHSAGSPVLVGNTSTTVALEQQISEFVGMKETVLYSTGWSAGFGVIKGLVRSHDYVVMDSLAHSCLQIGAQAAT